jgi:hypothetical protein
MKMVVVPVVQGEFEKLVEKYIDNLIKKFGGEVEYPVQLPLAAQAVGRLRGRTGLPALRPL